MKLLLAIVRCVQCNHGISRLTCFSISHKQCVFSFVPPSVLVHLYHWGCKFKFWVVTNSSIALIIVSCSYSAVPEKMPEGISAENLMNNIMETLSDGFREEKSNSVSSQFNRLFGRQKPVHHILGGGKCNHNLASSFCFVLLDLCSCWMIIFYLVCSCWCSVMEKQEDLSRCFDWCHGCLDPFWMAQLQFPVSFMLWSIFSGSWSVYMGKCFRHVKQVFYDFVFSPDSLFRSA